MFASIPNPITTGEIRTPHSVLNKTSLPAEEGLIRLPRRRPVECYSKPSDSTKQRRCLATKRADSVDYSRLFRAAHSGEKWKTQQAIGQIFCDGTVALVTTKSETHRREM